MFFLLPVAHEESAARRIPLVSLLLVAINVVVFFGVQQLYEPSLQPPVESAIAAVSDRAEARPYLEVRCHVLEVTGRQVTRVPAPETLEPEEIAEQQAELDALCATAERALYTLPTFRFGDTPGRGGLLTLVTSQFLHGGLLHLLFNLWFLWLTACNLEDRWGRLVFAPFYLACGVVGALCHRFGTEHPWQPLIGASGAIAGAMGGFSVIFATTKIRMLYVFWLALRPRWGTFDAPAYLMLLLWLAGEALAALIGGDDGTAHWAHVGGFVFGALVAGGMRISKLDQRLDQAVDAKASVLGDARVATAAAAIERGDVAHALRELTALCDAEPGNIDARLELRRAAAISGDRATTARAMVELAALYLEQGAPTTSAELMVELGRDKLLDVAPRDRLLRFGERCAQRGAPELALSAVAAVHAGAIRDELALRAAIAHGVIALKAGNLNDARRLFDAAAASPYVTPELASKIAAQQAGLAARGG